MSTESAPAYEARKARLREQYAAFPGGAQFDWPSGPRTFRTRQRPPAPGLDVREFDGVLSVDTATRTADVQGMTT